MTGGIDEVREIMGQAEDVDLPDELRDEAQAAAEAGMGGGDDLPPEPPPADPADEDDGGKARRRALAPECAGFPLNDTGNGQRFKTYFGEDVMSVPRVGWFTWSGKVWQIDEDNIAVRRLAQQVSVLMEDEARVLALSDRQMALIDREQALKAEADKFAAKIATNQMTPEDEDSKRTVDRELTAIWSLKKTLSDLRKQHRSYAKTSGNTARIESMLTESSVHLTQPFAALDANALDVNCESGVLRFSVIGGPDAGFSRMSKVDLVEHARDQLITKMMPVTYDPDARAPRFEQFLREVQPSQEMRNFLRRWYGLNMTALTGEQKLVFNYGGGRNGKSVMAELMARILGPYAATAKIESLIGKNRRSGGDATPDLVPLMGARSVRASEPDEGERLQEGKIKEMTGGEPILVRALNKDFIEVLPVFKLTISGNHKPEIRGTDDGIWRRVLLVPWDVQIPKDKVDPDLVQKLVAEGPGILNWLVDGLCDYLEGGLREPASVLDATAEFRADSDPIGAFLADCTVITGEADDFMKSRDLVDAIVFWQMDNIGASWGSRTISNRLTERAGKYRHPATQKSYMAQKRGDTRGYSGIRLTDMFARSFDARHNKARETTPREDDEWSV